jgi:hypothetical protein
LRAARALASSNPDARKMAVVAPSLAAENGAQFGRLANALRDKDVDVRGFRRCSGF